MGRSASSQNKARVVRVNMISLLICFQLIPTLLQKKLIIYETTHFENLSALLVLSSTYFSEVTIFITEHSCKQLRHILKPLQLPLKINWVVQVKESNRGFIHKFFRHIFRSSYTHLHIGTLEHNKLLFAWHLRKLRHLRLSMTVHSINDYKSGLFKNIRDISETIAKKILHNTIQHYRVLAPAMLNAFEQAFPSKQVSFIPGNFSKQTDHLTLSTNPFTIVIPGTVEAKRRNYKLVVDFFETHVKDLLHYTSLHIILAGSADSPFGKRVTDALHKLADQYSFRVSTFMHILEQQEYETLYQQADIVWAPVILRTRGMRGVEEINAVTHSPGFITDQIYFGKPAIIPRGLQVPQQFTGCNWEYENESELVAIFTSILSRKSVLTEANRKISVACNHFSAENFTGAFKNLLASN